MQIAPGVVVPIEQRQLLVPTRGTVGGIQIGGDAPGVSLQTPTMPLGEESLPIGTAVPLVKLRHHGVGENIGEQLTLCCGKLSQTEASLGALNIDSTTCLHHTRAFVSIQAIAKPSARRS